MKRLRAFILSEILMTMILQAGFILTLFGAFYLMMEFYTKTQAVLTARDHAERVIQFMDDKIRAAGLGLWRCKKPEMVTNRFRNIPMLFERSNPVLAYKLPISVTWNDGTMEGTLKEVPLKSDPQKKGDVLTLIYAQRDLSSDTKYEIISMAAGATKFNVYPYDATVSTASMKLLDTSETNTKLFRNESLFDFNGLESNMRNYGVIEALGVPLYLESLSSNTLTVRVFNVATANEKLEIPAAGEFMYLRCMQMFVHDKNDGQGRQFAFRELKSSGAAWDSKYNQEKNILDIYMELDTSTNIFTLYVLAQGGYDAGVTNPRPSKELWPYHANPIPEGKTHDDEISDEEAENAWKGSKYCHYTVYVSRASWKLNNIPEDFSWN